MTSRIIQKNHVKQTKHIIVEKPEYGVWNDSVLNHSKIILLQLRLSGFLLLRCLGTTLHARQHIMCLTGAYMDTYDRYYLRYVRDEPYELIFVPRLGRRTDSKNN